MVTWVNGIVVCRICWFAVLAKKSVIWLSIPRISFGPALLKLLSRSWTPAPPLELKLTVGAEGPELSPKTDGIVIVSVPDNRSELPTWTPPPSEAVIVKVTGLETGVTWTLDG